MRRIRSDISGSGHHGGNVALLVVAAKMASKGTGSEDGHIVATMRLGVQRSRAHILKIGILRVPLAQFPASLSNLITTGIAGPIGVRKDGVRKVIVRQILT